MFLLESRQDMANSQEVLENCLILKSAIDNFILAENYRHMTLLKLITLTNYLHLRILETHLLTNAATSSSHERVVYQSRLDNYQKFFNYILTLLSHAENSTIEHALHVENLLQFVQFIEASERIFNSNYVLVEIEPKNGESPTHAQH